MFRFCLAKTNFIIINGELNILVLNRLGLKSSSSSFSSSDFLPCGDGERREKREESRKKKKEGGYGVCK